MTMPRPKATFIMVPCPCGRVLRARWDQVGTEIICWDCRRGTKVVVPLDRLRLFEQMTRSVVSLFEQRESSGIVVAAGLLTLALIVPYAGLGLAMVVLVCGAAVVYGDQIPLSPEPGTSSGPRWARIGRRMTWSRSLASLLFAAGTILPLWVINAGLHRSPHLDRISLPILALSWTILPIVMALVFDESPTTGSGWWRRWSFLGNHPLVSVVVLAIVPLSLVVGEVVVAGIIYLEQLLPIFALEFMPIPGQPESRNGILFYDQVCYVNLPPDRFIRGYFAGLGQGYSLVGSIPPSLSIATDANLNLDAVPMRHQNFYWIRVSLVFAISLILLLSSAVQARCLSVLVNAQGRRAG